ncbi:MAG: hypothetical protein ACXAB8_05030 [Promethearchaeota archaeon]
MTVSELTVCSFPQISTAVLSTTRESLTSGALLNVIYLCGYKTTRLPFNKGGYFLSKYLLIW